MASVGVEEAEGKRRGSRRGSGEDAGHTVSFRSLSLHISMLISTVCTAFSLCKQTTTNTNNNKWHLQQLPTVKREGEGEE